MLWNTIRGWTHINACGHCLCQIIYWQYDIEHSYNFFSIEYSVNRNGPLSHSYPNVKGPSRLDNSNLSPASGIVGSSVKVQVGSSVGSPSISGAVIRRWW